MIAKLICGSLMFAGRFTNINFIYFDFIDEKKKKKFLFELWKGKKTIKIVAFLEIGDILRFICYNNLLFLISTKIDFGLKDILGKQCVLNYWTHCAGYAGYTGYTGFALGVSMQYAEHAVCRIIQYSVCTMQ